MSNPNPQTPTLIYIEGAVNLDTYQAAYRDEQSRMGYRNYKVPYSPIHENIMIKILAIAKSNL